MEEIGTKEKSSKEKGKDITHILFNGKMCNSEKEN